VACSRASLLVLALFTALLFASLAFREEEWLEALLLLGLGGLLLLWTWQWSGAPRRRPLLARERFLIGNGEIIPRRDASMEQLKRLGDALSRWWQCEWAGTGRGLHWIDTGAIDDLLSGELPQPFVLRLLTEVNQRSPSTGGAEAVASAPRMTSRELRDALQRARQVYPHLSQLIPQADARTVQFGLGPKSKLDRARLLASLRRAVPADLVEDVLIEGQSWNAVD
jgi:hypothetical protein